MALWYGCGQALIQIPIKFNVIWFIRVNGVLVTGSDSPNGFSAEWAVLQCPGLCPGFGLACIVVAEGEGNGSVAMLVEMFGYLWIFFATGQSWDIFIPHTIIIV